MAEPDPDIAERSVNTCRDEMFLHVFSTRTLRATGRVTRQGEAGEKQVCRSDFITFLQPDY